MENSGLLNFPPLVTWGNLTFVPLPEWEMQKMPITARLSRVRLIRVNGTNTSTRQVVLRPVLLSIKFGIQILKIPLHHKSSFESDKTLFDKLRQRGLQKR